MTDSIGKEKMIAALREYYSECKAKGLTAEQANESALDIMENAFKGSVQRRRDALHIVEKSDINENAEMIAVITATLADAIKDNDRGSIRQVGEDLNGLGGVVLMRRALDEATEHLDEPEYGRWRSIIDHAWDRIGDWLA